MNGNVPPEFWYCLASVVVTLLVSAAHRRGHRLPLVEIILDLVHGERRPEVTLQTILDEIRRRLPEPPRS